ncbi:MAG: excinuclease ABC subunit UvrA [Pirellulales bacterium]
MYGGRFDGLIPQFLSQWNSYKSPMARRYFEKYMQTLHCDVCDGQRLNPQARHVKLKTLSKAFKKSPWRSLPQVGELSLDQCFDFFESLDLSATQQQIAGEALKEIRSRLGFLLDVGLSYLCLNRTAPTLSGGESQRIRLASQIGSGLVGVLYVLDEPSIGLHPRDNDRLLQSLKRLRDLGNTLIVVEHDEETMREADMIVDFGPGPGVRGGEIVTTGSLPEIIRHPRSVTGGYLSGRLKMERPKTRRKGNGQQITIRGAAQNNLQNIDVSLPLGQFVCVTGVSGSGKSSLISDILTPALRRDLNAAECLPGKHRSIEGIEHLDKIIDIDQSPIGRTPRSNPATYVKVFDEIRDLFAQLPEAKARGYQPGRFSFNTEEGRCAACEGNGSVKLAMELVADLWVPCTVCNGKRYDRETLQVTFKGKSIADCLELDVQEALEHFQHLPKIADKLRTLHDVGLDYLKLGQPSPTLSGGEAQRIKLAKELSRRDTGRTLYVLDEPTTGLHFADIALLLKVLQSLVDRGNTVVVVEHNLDMIQAADWIIDMGPEGGSGGGQILAEGTPEQVAKNSKSHTGRSLAAYFERHSSKPKFAKKARKTSDSHRRGWQEIVVEGASMHNLQHIHLTLPRNQLTVLCGPSGSGKTSLAMDTIYAEGQRRYVESLSAYARQFVGQMPKPTVERIDGLSPAVSLEQRNLGHTPRSTVGTVTEIYDYLRVFMARLGTMHCPRCQRAVGTQTAQEITDAIMSYPQGTKLLLLAPLSMERGGDWKRRFEELHKEGFVRFRIDGTTWNYEELPELQRTSQHQVQIVIDRLKIDRGGRTRIADSVETALGVGLGVIQVAISDDRPEAAWDVHTHSRHLACHACKTSYQPLTPHSFSFNSSLGWCPSCEGLGVQTGANPTAFMDMARSLNEGGFLLWPQPSTTSASSMSQAMLQALGRASGIPLDVPIGKLQARHLQKLLFGTGELWIEVHGTQGKGASQAGSFRFQFRGIYPALEQASRSSTLWRSKLLSFVAEVPCMSCSGARVRPEAAACRWDGLTIVDLVHMPLETLRSTVQQWKLDARQQKIAGELLREIQNRLEFLVDVGLNYLNLSRSANSLSGGESQRIRLASQLGSGLCGILYVLDEPTIGLHPRDNDRLIRALHRLRDLGNTLLVVEHDKDVIASSDHLCDFGPGSGRNGGRVVGQGSPKAVAKQATSVTGPYLSGKKAIPIPQRRPTVPEPPGGGWLIVRGAKENTLRNIDVCFPLGCFIAVTGPSGSGKSSLVNDILYPALANHLHHAGHRVGLHSKMEGVEQIDKVVMVDQTPLGVSPSSNPRPIPVSSS